MDYDKIWHFSFKVSDDRKIIESSKIMAVSYEGNSYMKRCGKELHWELATPVDESPRTREIDENYFRRLYHTETVLHDETKMKLQLSEARVHEQKQENTEFRTKLAIFSIICLSVCIAVIKTAKKIV